MQKFSNIIRREQSYFTTHSYERHGHVGVNAVNIMYFVKESFQQITKITASTSLV